MKKTSLAAIAALCVLVLAAISARADDTLTMTSVHSVTEKSRDILFTITLNNPGLTPVSVLTVFSTPLSSSRGGILLVTFRPPADADGNIAMADRMPRTIAPGGSLVITQTVPIPGTQPPQADYPTTVKISVPKEIGERYHVWSGDLLAQSSYVPFQKD